MNDPKLSRLVALSMVGGESRQEKDHFCSKVHASALGPSEWIRPWRLQPAHWVQEDTCTLPEIPAKSLVPSAVFSADSGRERLLFRTTATLVLLSVCSKPKSLFGC